MEMGFLKEFMKMLIFSSNATQAKSAESGD
jgi:hypothetical protein